MQWLKSLSHRIKQYWMWNKCHCSTQQDWWQTCIYCIYTQDHLFPITRKFSHEDIPVIFSHIQHIIFIYSDLCQIKILNNIVTSHTHHILDHYSGEWILGKQLQVHLVAHGHIQGICRNGRWNTSGLFKPYTACSLCFCPVKVIFY